jgi:alkanesulfonate monooxygenase SsuD/methylene tetrahydromethanopterin reductase-like flavin-dependent oxidoreductase (luciferase family)
MLCGLDPRGPREHWEEAAETLLRGLDTGVVETDGPAFAPSRVEVRPRPARGVRDRLYMVATSPEAIDAAAELGARLFVRTGRPIERHALDIDRWRAGFREHRGSEPAPPVLADQLYVHEDPREAERVARRCLDSFGTQLWGTPEQLLDRYRHRVEVIGEFFTNLVFSPPGLDLDAAQASMCLFAREVLPELHRLRVPVAAACGADT